MEKKNVLGEWTVTRKGDRQIVVDLPEGMLIEKDNLTIEELADAIDRYKTLKDGEITDVDGEITVKCCSGGVVIA